MKDLVEGVTNHADGLGYDLRLDHVGVIAAGDGAAGALRDLARSSNTRLFHVPGPAGLVWAWLGTRSFASGQLKAVRHFNNARPGATLAIGQAHAGIDGFRLTHRQAGTAHVIASRGGGPVTFYEDVALEGMVMRDETTAREFVSHALGDLERDDQHSPQLRDTLRAYFRSEQNQTATAATLGIHGATVARHLAEVERRTGHRVNQRRVELETALRLKALLDQEPA